ncbi:MAG: hypothetical protein IJ005_01865 [Bacteroidales bacterium]|nr:hypothetical protein [Bacteroidales bacterium]
MKHDILKVVTSFAAIAYALAVHAQDLDPTVVVDRAYEGKLMEVHKPQLQMAVPDSVMQFALDFDYSVFESPYKGSYEFSPYLLSFKPDASKDGSGVLYFNAGAGYGLHPVFDAVWSPRTGGRFGVDVYASHRSYVGEWWNIGPEKSENGPFRLERESGAWYGYDLMTEAGADFRYDWNKGVLGFGVGYDGIAARDRIARHSFNALKLDFSLGSKVTRDNGFVYKVDASWLSGGDRARGTADFSRMTENLFALDATFGPAFRDSHRILFDVGMDLVDYGGLDNVGAGQFHIVPHYAYRKGRLYVDFGVRFAKILDSDPDDGAYGAEKLEQMVYPDITFEWVALPDALKLHAHVGGGNRLNTYSSVLKRNHHFNISVPVSPQLDYTVERISAVASLEGRITSRFSYELRGGYVCYGNGLLDAVYSDGQQRPVYEMGYDGWHKGFAAACLSWKNEFLTIDGSVEYSNVWGDAFDASSHFIRPSAFNGSLSVEYNWKRRIYAGVGCVFATSRESAFVSLPGYADLRINAEYAINRRLSLWMRGGNLLGMTIQRVPLYAEKGAYVTLGLTFKY